ILKNDVNKADLAKANSMLTVLDPSIKRELNKPDEITLRIDKILLHRFWGLLFFFLIMAVTFTSIFWVADPLMGLVDELFGIMAGFASGILGETWYGYLVSEGII